MGSSRRFRTVKCDSYKWMTPVCTLKFDASHFPFECEPFWDKWRNVLAPEPDCAKCEVSKEYGLIAEDDPPDDPPSEKKEEEKK